MALLDANLSQIPQFVAATPSREDKMFLWPESFSEYHPTSQMNNVPA